MPKQSDDVQYPRIDLRQPQFVPVARRLDGPKDQGQKDRALLHGAHQGITGGFVDEIGGATAAVMRPTFQRIFGIDDDLQAAGLPDRPLWDGEQYQVERDKIRQQHADIRAGDPAIYTVGEVIGGLVGGGGAFGKAASAGGVARAVAVGGAEGGLMGAGYSEGETLDDVVIDSLKAASIGSVGAGIFRGVARGFNGIKAMLASEPYKRSVGVLKQHGITTLSAGQETGGKFLRSMESILRGVPIVGGARRLERTRLDFQRGLLRLAGLEGPRLKPGLINEDTLKTARGQVGARYRRALSGSDGLPKAVVIDDPQFRKELTQIERRHGELLTLEQKGPISAVVGELLDVVKTKAPGPEMVGGSRVRYAPDSPTPAQHAPPPSHFTGERYQHVRSLIGQKYRQYAEDPAANSKALAALYQDLRQSLDDAWQRATPTPELQAINKQYANLSTLEDFHKGATSNTQQVGAVLEGHISPAELAHFARQHPTSSEFEELAKAGGMVIPSTSPNAEDWSKAIAATAVGAGGVGLLSGPANPQEESAHRSSQDVTLGDYATHFATFLATLYGVNKVLGNGQRAGQVLNALENALERGSSIPGTAAGVGAIVAPAAGALREPSAREPSARPTPPGLDDQFPRIRGG